MTMGELAASIRRDALAPAIIIAFVIGFSATAADASEPCENAKDPDTQIAVCTTQIESSDESRLDSISDHQLRGFAYFEKNQYDNAIVDFSWVIEQIPQLSANDFTDADRKGLDIVLSLTYAGRGLARAPKGEFAAAIEDYSHAISLKHRPKDSPTFYRCRGVLYVMSGIAYGHTNAEHYYRLAVDDLRQSIAYEPTNTLALFDLGIAEQDLGRATKSQSLISQGAGDIARAKARDPHVGDHGISW